MKRTLATLMLAAPLVHGCQSSDPALPVTNPPPVTGGTLTITPDGLAVAADPDRDVVWLVDLGSSATSSVALAAGDQPGRVVVDAAGSAHVVLRGAGAVARIDPRRGVLLDRRGVCPAPRGLAYDGAADAIHVACAGGELVTLPAAGGQAVRSLRLDPDLRDVIVAGDQLFVSRFRSAELLVVSPAGQLVGRQKPLPRGDPSLANGGTTTVAVPTVAWRTTQLPGGGVAMVHELATSSVVGTNAGAYAWSGPCSGPVVASTLTFFGGSGERVDDRPMPVLPPVLPVDVAADDQDNLAVVSAGDDTVSFLGPPATIEASASADGCATLAGATAVSLTAQPVAVASWQGRWFVQTRDVAQILEIGGVSSGQPTVASTIDLGAPAIESPGSAIFHTSWTGMACASCHPEGGEDGHTWLFDTAGPRRTQSLSGGVMHRAPFHWRGELPDFQSLVDDVLVGRMGGNSPSTIDVAAFSRWLDRLPAPAASPTGTPAQIEHGKQLFQDSAVGCASCHSGPYLTNDQIAYVGTGTTFQVPSLVGISAVAPFFHDGCAATLQDRFDPTKAACNGGDLHGHTSQLGAQDVNDLIAYLETL
jgi:hypothetical protein